MRSVPVLPTGRLNVVVSMSDVAVLIAQVWTPVMFIVAVSTVGVGGRLATVCAVVPVSNIAVVDDAGDGIVQEIVTVAVDKTSPFTVTSRLAVFRVSTTVTPSAPLLS